MFLNILVFTLIGVLIGVCLGAGLVYRYLEAKHEKAYSEKLEIEKQKALQIIRNNCATEETNRKMLLEELGEVLDIDVVELPTFGYTILKGAMEVTEDDVWPHMRDLYE